MAQDAAGMKGDRSRNKTGELRKTRADKYVGTVEKEYGVNLNARSDMEIGNYLKREGLHSVHEAVHKNQK